MNITGLKDIRRCRILNVCHKASERLQSTKNINNAIKSDGAIGLFETTTFRVYNIAVSIIVSKCCIEHIHCALRLFTEHTSDLICRSI